jgi:two-component sensor histidine kinase
VQTIAERAESLARLVDQLLLGSRAGANRLTVTSEPFDLAGLLADIATVFRPLSDRHTLVALVPDDLPEAYGDAAATDSIVSQLIENAFKYSPEGGTVTITAADIPETGEVEVTVRDEGIGIAPADVERVFERFVQGEAGDRRRFGGIGLGLYIVRQLARAQGGEVTAAPAPGGGTVMRLTLPRAAGASADAPPEDVSADGAPEGGADRACAASEPGQAAAPDLENGGAPVADEAAATSGPADVGTGAAPEPADAADPIGAEAEPTELKAEPQGSADATAGDGDAAEAAGDAAASGSADGEDGEAPEPAESTDPDAKPRAHGRRLPPVLARLPIPRSTSDRSAGRKG